MLKYLPILGDLMRIAGPLRGSAVDDRAGVLPSPRWLGLVPWAWWALADWPARMPLVHGRTGPRQRQSRPRMQAQYSRAAAGTGGGDVVGWGQRRRHRLSYLLSRRRLSSHRFRRAPRTGTSDRVLGPIAYADRHPGQPGTQNVLLQIVGAVSLPDIEAVLGLSIGRHLAQRQTLSARPSSGTASGRPPVTRVPVVLLPHAPTEPANPRPATRRGARATSVNDGDQGLRHHPGGGAATIPVSAARQWHDAELAMKVARHSFDRWITASDQDPRSLASMHAQHTRTAVYEAARALATLINTLDAQATTPTTTPARHTQ